jgi:hypothetical protein
LFMVACNTKFGSGCATTLQRTLRYLKHRPSACARFVSVSHSTTHLCSLDCICILKSVNAHSYKSFPRNPLIKWENRLRFQEALQLVLIVPRLSRNFHFIFNLMRLSHQLTNSIEQNPVKSCRTLT